MAWQGNQSRCHNASLLLITCHPRSLHPRLLYLHILRKSRRSIEVMKYIPTCTTFHVLVRVYSNLFLQPQMPTSNNLSSAASSFWPCRILLSAMYHFQTGHLDARSLIWVIHWWIRRSHCSGLVTWLLMLPMDWAISHTRSLTLLSVCCCVKPPFSCQHRMVSAAHWLTPTPAFLAQMQTFCVGIQIVLAAATTGFGNYRASHYILGSQLWSVIEWSISHACWSKQASGVLNISSSAMQYGSKGEEGVSMVLEIVCRVGRQGEYIYGLGGVSWSGDIILAAFQIGGNLLSII